MRVGRGDQNANKVDITKQLVITDNLMLTLVDLHLDDSLTIHGHVEKTCDFLV